MRCELQVDWAGVDLPGEKGLGLRDETPSLPLLLLSTSWCSVSTSILHPRSALRRTTVSSNWRLSLYVSVTLAHEQGPATELCCATSAPEAAEGPLAGRAGEGQTKSPPRVAAPAVSQRRRSAVL